MDYQGFIINTIVHVANMHILQLHMAFQTVEERRMRFPLIRRSFFIIYKFMLLSECSPLRLRRLTVGQHGGYGGDRSPRNRQTESKKDSSAASAC